MSSQLSIHIGFYFEVKSQLIEHTDSKSLCCQCGNKSSSRFCPSCGGEVREYRQKSHKHSVRPQDLLGEAFGDDIQAVNYLQHIWLFNFHVQDGQGNNFGHDLDGRSDGKAVEVKPLEVVAAEPFVRQHPTVSAIMRTMQSQYGPDAIELKYGTVTSWA
jgi:hypothetical protein